MRGSYCSLNGLGGPPANGIDSTARSRHVGEHLSALCQIIDGTVNLLDLCHEGSCLLSWNGRAGAGSCRWSLLFPRRLPRGWPLLIIVVRHIFGSRDASKTGACSAVSMGSKERIRQKGRE